VRFLIDECLTVDLVTVAGQAGHDAQHVARVGKAGWKDWNVVRYAADGDFILVTNQCGRFPAALCRPAATCPRRQILPAHLPRPPAAGCGERYRIAAEAEVKPIDCWHQCDAARAVRLIEQPLLYRRGRMQNEQHDAGLCSDSRHARLI
jgi:uncharacterized protein DUF5615